MHSTAREVKTVKTRLCTFSGVYFFGLITFNTLQFSTSDYGLPFLAGFFLLCYPHKSGNYKLPERVRVRSCFRLVLQGGAIRLPPLFDQGEVLYIYRVPGAILLAYPEGRLVVVFRQRQFRFEEEELFVLLPRNIVADRVVVIKQDRRI